MPSNKSRSAVPLREVIGRRVRAIREQAGARQDDVAKVARLHGLAWSRAKVAELESGRKPVDIEELVILSAVLSMVRGTGTYPPVSVTDLLAEATTVRLSRTVTAPADMVSGVLAGRASPEELDVEVLRKIDASVEAELAELAEIEKAYPRLSKVSTDLRLRVLNASAEAEIKAARRLQCSPLLLALASAALWGCALSQKRDALLADEVSDDMPPRTQQARRGRITRALTVELEEFIRTEQKDSHGKR